MRKVQRLIKNRSFWGGILVFIILGLATNLGIPQLNGKLQFDESDLPSVILEEGVPRTVTDGKKGCLTFGPYIDLAAGEYNILVYYFTDTDENTVDVYSLGEYLYQGNLKKDEKIHVINLRLEEETKKTEIRLLYSGTGTLSMQKLEIVPVRADLLVIKKTLNIVLILTALVWMFSVIRTNENLKKENVSAGSFRERTRRAFPVTLLFAFTFCMAGPIGLYLGNTKEFWFSLWQMIPAITITFLLVWVFLTGVICFFRNYVFCLVLLVLFGASIALYIEGNYLVQDYGLLNGAAIEWDSFAGWGIIDTLIWCICLLVPIFLAKAWKKFSFKITGVISIMLLLTQVVALSLMFMGTKSVDGNANCVLTTDGYNTVSDNENIIIFILDAFDAQLMEDTLESHPEYKEEFTDFVFYRDAATSGAMTHIAMPIILTGQLYKDKVSYDEYITQSYHRTPLYKALAEHDYNVGLYTNSRFVDKSQEEYILNVHSGKAPINSPVIFAERIMDLVAFRYLPHIFKSQFTIYSGVFDELKGEEGEYEPYDGGNDAYVRLHEPLSFTSDKNAFRLYHVMGAHLPYSLDETGNIVDSSKTTEEKQVMGCFYLIDHYISQLKQMNVYDDSTIIIMADHGAGTIPVNPLFMIKSKNYKGDFSISYAPISYIDLLPTLMEIIGEDASKYGRKISDISEGEERLRYFYMDNPGVEVRHITEYSSIGKADNDDEWMETGVVYYGDATPGKRKYTLGTELSFGREATGNYYAVEGFTRVNDSFTIATSDKGKMIFEFKSVPKGDIRVTLSVTSRTGSKSKMVIYANGTEVYNEEHTNGTFAFIVSKENVGKALELDFCFPDAEDAGWHLSSFNFNRIIIEEN